MWAAACALWLTMIVAAMRSVDWERLPASLAITEILWALVLTSFAIAAAMIIARQPRNSIGWTLLVPATLGYLDPILIRPLADIASAPPVTPWLLIQLWVDGFAWIFLVFPVFHLLLVFPSGRAVSPRWRWLIGLEVAMVISFLALIVFGAQLGALDENDTFRWVVTNPIGFIPQEFYESPAFGIPWTVGLLVLTFGGVASMVVRYRRGASVERQQVKLVLLAVALFGAVYAPLAIFGSEIQAGSLVDIVFVLSFLFIPTAIVASILRYRLFDIDLLIRRTILYALLAGSLAGAYFALVAGLSTFLPSEEPLVVALSTLTVAGLFNPIRHRLHRVLEMRFNRSRYDRETLLGGFANSLGNIVDPDGIIDGWLDVVSQTMQPTLQGVWLRERGT